MAKASLLFGDQALPGKEPKRPSFIQQVFIKHPQGARWSPSLSKTGRLSRPGTKLPMSLVD